MQEIEPEIIEFPAGQIATASGITAIAIGAANQVDVLSSFISEHAGDIAIYCLILSTLLQVVFGIMNQYHSSKKSKALDLDERRRSLDEREALLDKRERHNKKNS